MVLRHPWSITVALLAAASFAVSPAREAPVSAVPSLPHPKAMCNVRFEGRPYEPPERAVSGAESDVLDPVPVSSDVMYAVSVTPDGGTASWPQNTTGHQATFTVKNTGTCSDTYSLSGSGTGGITGISVSPASVSPSPNGGTASVTVTYNVASPALATLTLSADGSIGGASDNGYYNVTVYGVTISLAPQNGGTRPVDPFDVVQAVTTPAYQSVEAPRGVTLLYNSSTVRPTPVLSVNVATSTGMLSTTYQLQVQLVSNQTFLTLLNGATSVFYAAPGDTTTTRLVAAIDAKANNLTTGWYDVNVIVTPYNGSTPGAAVTATTRFLVDYESASPFGAGWQIAGLQRLNTMSGSYSALITNGDGSMAFFRRDCSTCAFVSPAGDPTQLEVYTGPDTGIAYRRAAPDSSATDFRSDGRLVRSWSGELYRPVLIANWSGTQLGSIQDLIGKKLTLSYTQSGKLQTITDPSGRVTTISIDSTGKLYRATDPDSLTTNFAYDTLLRLTSVTDRAGATAVLTYDALNRRDSTKAPSIADYTGSLKQPIATTTAAERIAWQPATAGTSIGTAKAAVRPDTLSAKLIDPLGNVTRNAYDRFAGVTKIVDPLGQITTIGRDTLGNVTYTHTPTGHAGTSAYSGYLLSSTYDSTTKQSATYTYNGFNRVQTVTGNGGTTRIDYYYKLPHSGSGDFGLLDHVYVGNTSGSHASPSGGLLAAVYQYNIWGQDSIIVDGAGHATTFLYSDTAHYSNPVQVTDPFSRVVSKAHYDGLGRPDTVWAPSNGSLAPTVLTYDQLNRTRTVRSPLGFTTQYVYGPITLNRVIDAKGKVYRFDYNALAWMTIQHDLADTTKADTLKYDVGGLLRKVQTRRSDAISLTYDAIGRVLTRSGPDFPVDSFKYDPSGRWMVAVDSNAYDSLAFDVAGRMAYSLERLTGDSNYSMSFTYDTLGRVKTRSAPRLGSSLTFGYNPGRATLDTVCAGVQCSVWTNRDADNIAHVLGFAVNNAQYFQMNIYTDSAHRMVSDSFSGQTLHIQQLDSAFSKSWTYDTLGRVTFESPFGSQYGSGGFLYAYDSNGRLVNACADSSRFVNPPGLLEFRCFDEYGVDRGQSSGTPYRYDSTGNRTDSLANAVIGSGNRVTQFKGYVLAYDANGNIVSKKGLGGSSPVDTTLFTWDAASRLKRVERWTGGGTHTIITYAYDAFGRRVAKAVGSTTERYVHQGDQVVEDVDGATHALKADYTWTPGAADKLLYIRTAGWTAGVITDPLNGSVRGFANVSNGQPMKQYPASYWGAVATDTGFVLRFRHAGREYDAEAGLYYNRARYYDPQLGRFLSEDPQGIAAGANLYAYAGDDPINHTDPSGQDCYDDAYTWAEVEADGDPIQEALDLCGGDPGTDPSTNDTGDPVPDPMDPVTVWGAPDPFHWTCYPSMGSGCDFWAHSDWGAMTGLGEGYDALMGNGEIFAQGSETSQRACDIHAGAGTRFGPNCNRTNVACYELGHQVELGYGRAIWASPMFLWDMVFHARVPNVRIRGVEVPVPDPRDFETPPDLSSPPYKSFDVMARGLQEETRASNLYWGLGCRPGEPQLEHH